MKRVAILFLGLALFCGAAFAQVSTGGVSTDKQIWDGPKIFKRLAPRVATLAGAETLGLDAQQIQHLDPDGSSRNITLAIPADANKGLWFRFKNTGNGGGGENLVIKDADGNTIGTVANSEVGDFRVSNSSTWTAEIYGAAFAGGLAADGSVPGATGEAQDFGTNGVKADVVAESTGAAGVTVDGVVIKDAGLTIGTSGVLDLNGEADALTLDSDGNTSISAPTDNQIDIEVNGADDFRITANTLTALSGSTIATNTIAETTAASGVTIDGLLVKDAGIVAGTSGYVDLNGETGGLIFDADANTKIYPSADDVITVNVAGATDFTIAANLLTAASGSVIATNTISETTAGSGVTIDGVLLKDSKVTVTTAGLIMSDSNASHTVTLQMGDEAADRTLSVPVLGGADTLMTLGTAQTVTGVKTMSGANIITFANASGLKILDTGADHTLAIITATDEAASYTMTIPDLSGNDTFATLGTAQTFTGAKTWASAAGSMVRASQRYRYTGGWKVGAAAGFVVNAADNIFAATCPASQTAATLIVPIPTLKVGNVITAFGLLGQIESAGNAVTVDADLRKQTTAAGDFTDASVSTITQIAVTADTAIDSTQDKTGLSTTILQTESYYIKITVTTNAATDVDIRGVTLVITEQ